MKRKLLLLLMQLPLVANAYDAKINNIYYNFSGNEAEVTYQKKYHEPWEDDDYTGVVIIPSLVTYNDVTYSVTSIGEYAFCYCDGIISVTIPNSVTSIGNNAFSSCCSLTSITIPNSVTSIGNSAFYACRNLAYVSFSKNVTNIESGVFEGTAWYDNQPDGLIYIGKVAYKYKGSMPSGTEIAINDGTLGIASNAFCYCGGLTSVTIPSSVTDIGDKAFYCTNLANISFSENVTTMGSDVFDYTPWYNNQPDGLIYIGKVAYKYKGSMPSGTEIAINDGTLGIVSNAFDNCNGLTSVTIPNSVTSIGEYAFGWCSGLTSVTIPNSVTSISDGTFAGCSGLTSVTIPNSVKSIGNAAFYCCTGLTSVTIPGSVTGIGYDAFSGCDNLTSITIPESVTNIGNNAFSCCNSLTSITIPESVTNIGNRAFQNCSGLGAIVVEQGNPTYDSRNNCNAIIETTSNKLIVGCKSTFIPNNVTSIGSYAFDLCGDLASITISVGILSIEDNAFYGTFPKKVIWLTNTPPKGLKNANGVVNYVANDRYSDLNNVMVYQFLSSMFEVDGVKYVPVSPSERTCDAIDCAYNELAENMIIGKTVTNRGVSLTIRQLNPYLCYGNPYIKETHVSFAGMLPDYAFSSCRALQTTDLGEEITSIGNNAFSGCQMLEDIVIPDSVISIGNNAFEDCSSITTIQIPQSVTAIADNVFVGCKNLRTFLMDDGETELSLGSNGHKPLFADCPLDSVYIGRNIIYPTAYIKGYSPFYRNMKLRTVTITDEETEISKNEFYGCANLKDIKIGDGVTNFGDYAFSGCSSLESFVFGSNVKTIGKETFSDCSAIKQLVSKASTPPTCGSQALDDINKWTCKLWVPEDCDTVYQQAGQWKEFFFIEEGTGDDSPVEDIDIVFADINVKDICVANWDTNGDGKLSKEEAAAATDLGVVFKGNTNINSFNELNYFTGLTSITSAFSGCSNLSSITIPESVTSITKGAFKDCSNLTSVTIESNAIVSEARTSSTSMKVIFGDQVKEYIIGNEVEIIGDSAFYGCTNLISVTIGSGVLSIGNEAFYDTSLKKVIWLTNTPPTRYNYVNSTINYVANNQYSALSNIKVYPFLSSMFEVDGVKYVPVSPSERTCDAIDCAYNESAENINISKKVVNKRVSLTVKQLNPYLCYGNPFITDVYLSFNGILPDYAFYGCSALQTADLGRNVTSIGSNAFSDCPILGNVVIPASVSSIDNNAFEGCSSITAFQIPKSVTTIADNVFGGCTSLKTFLIDDGGRELSLGSNHSNPLFVDCPLDSVYIGRNIVYPTASEKGYSPFFHNTSLRSVTITDEETEISMNEFYGCINLKDVKIGDGVTTIGDNAFSGCISLKAFSFGSSVETIGQEAFSDCVSMTTLISKAETPPTCGSQALDDINKWECTLLVPDGFVEAYQAAPQWKEFFFIEIDPDAINDVMADEGEKEGICYDAQGRMIGMPQKGINIIRYSDGTSRKVLVK